MAAGDSPAYAVDGQADFSGGQDASKTPDKVPDNAYFAGINLTTQNGSIGPRDGFWHQELVYPEGGITLNGRLYSYANIFESGKFQALIPYYYNGNYYLIIIISGVTFLLNVYTNTVTVLSFSDGTLFNGVAKRLNWSLAGNYVVIFDFPNRPGIIEGLNLRRSDLAADEVPISVLGAYNQNRLFIANAGNEFTGGDPSGSLAAPDAPITFLEVQQPAAPFLGQIFQLPTQYATDPITAMGFLQVVDTSTGIGALIISTANQVFAAQSQLPRDNWEQGQFVSVIVQNAGIAGPRALTNVNGDMFFVDTEANVRSLSMSRSEQAKWSKVPLSREVRNWLKYWDKSLVEFSFIGYFNNRIYVSANPFRVTSRTIDGKPIPDYCFGGLAVLELANISNIRNEAPPSWAGLWTGIRPMDMCTIGGKCFIVSKDHETINRVYELKTDVTVDKIRGKYRQVKSTLYSRTYAWGDSFINKQIMFGDFPFENVQGKLKVALSYKPSFSPDFIPWRIFNHNAPFETCTVPATPCETIGFAPQSFNSLYLGGPPQDGCDPVTKQMFSYFRKTQIKLEIEARYWELDSFKLKAITKPESDTQSVCSCYPTIGVCAPCDTDWAIPGLTDCPDEDICP